MSLSVHQRFWMRNPRSATFYVSSKSVTVERGYNDYTDSLGGELNKGQRVESGAVQNDVHVRGIRVVSATNVTEGRDNNIDAYRVVGQYRVGRHHDCGHSDSDSVIERIIGSGTGQTAKNLAKMAYQRVEKKSAYNLVTGITHLHRAPFEFSRCVFVSH